MYLVHVYVKQLSTLSLSVYSIFMSAMCITGSIMLQIICAYGDRDLKSIIIFKHVPMDGLSPKNGMTYITCFIRL